VYQTHHLNQCKSALAADAQALSKKAQLVPLIAETGGQNAMIVDSSALAEQVVHDVVMSAFDSAGQRCSALRVLCGQEDVADRIIAMIKGAMAEYQIGNPDQLAVDIGPVIDAEAQANIEQYITTMQSRGHNIERLGRSEINTLAKGTFVMPTLIILNSLSELESEVFGPVLHVLRYRREYLDVLVDQINATGYGLTLGLHTRINETIDRVIDRAHVGNMYVNRNVVGAVVGVQPFGGEGLSGTGPKAGGPLYLYRLLSNRPEDAVGRTLARIDNGQQPDSRLRDIAVRKNNNALDLFKTWANNQDHKHLVSLCDHYADLSQSGLTRNFSGPTGENNTYRLLPRSPVLCLASSKDDLLTQFVAVLVVGATAIWEDNTLTRRLFESLPIEVAAQIQLVADWRSKDLSFDLVIYHGETQIPLERLLFERVVSVNTAAAGGNASLMTIS